MTSPGREPDYTGDGGGSGGFALPVFVAGTQTFKDDPISSEINFTSGDFRVRRVDVAGPATVTGTWQMSASVYEGFVVWYEETLRVGALAFNLTVMNLGPGVATRTALFLEPYQATTDDGLNYTVTAKLQVSDSFSVLIPSPSLDPNRRLPYQVYLLDTFSVDEPPIVDSVAPKARFPDAGAVTITGRVPVSVIGYVKQPPVGVGITITGAVPAVLINATRVLQPGTGAILMGQLYPPGVAVTGAGGGAVYPNVGATFGNNVSALAVPVNDVPIYIRRARTIVGVSILTRGGTGSCVVDIWKAAYGSYPPTAANSICASAKPTISSSIKYLDTTLTGWTTAVAAGDTLIFSLTSTSTFTLVSISLHFTEP